MVKESIYSVEDRGSIPGSGRFPGGGKGNPLQYSFVGNPMDSRTWWATVHRLAKSQTQLSDWPHSTIKTLNLHFINGKVNNERIWLSFHSNYSFYILNVKTEEFGNDERLWCYLRAWWLHIKGASIPSRMIFS